MELLFINNVIVNWLYIERRQKRQKEDRKRQNISFYIIWILYLVFRYHI